MYTKIENTSIETDLKAKTWLFIASGRDGSLYAFNTFVSTAKASKAKMYKNLKSLVKDGFINTDYWRLV